MKLIDLEVWDFQSYDHAKIAFAEEKITFITGIDRDTSSSNGVGKSGIKEAILFALSGRSKVKGPNLIRRGQKSTKVRLFLEHNGLLVEITRQRKPTVSSLELVINGVEQVGMPEALQKQIEEVLGLNLDSFISYSIIDKVRDTDLTKLSSADLRVILQDLVGITKLQKVTDKINKKKNIVEGFLAKKHIRHFPSTTRMKTLVDAKKDLEHKRDEIVKEIVSLTSSQSIITVDLRTSNSKILELKELRNKTLTEKVCTQCGAPIKSASKIDILNKIQEDLQALEARIKDLTLDQANIAPKLIDLNKASQKLNTKLCKCLTFKTKLEESLRDISDVKEVEKELKLYLDSLACLQTYITKSLQVIATQIEDQMNAELGRFTSLTCNIALSKINTSGLLVPSCTINVQRDGHDFDFDMLSSGEQALLSIVYKLVISSLKGNVEILFIDEGLDALDEINRERILNVLETSRYRQIFIISHREDSSHLKTGQRILIKKEEGISSIITA